MHLSRRQFLHLVGGVGTSSFLGIAMRAGERLVDARSAVDVDPAPSKTSIVS